MEVWRRYKKGEEVSINYHFVERLYEMQEMIRIWGPKVKSGNQRLYETFLSSGYNPGSCSKAEKLQVIPVTPRIPGEGSVLFQGIENFANNYANSSKYFL